jgi:ATP-dependent Lon protease
MIKQKKRKLSNTNNSDSDSDSDYNSDSDFVVSDINKSEKDEFLKSCGMYNLPSNWKTNNTSKLSKTNIKLCSERYNDIKKTLMDEQINLHMILSMNNILETERQILINKYSLMKCSQNDLLSYIKLKNELWNMINYYNNTDMKVRKINIEKKKELDSIIINTSELENKILNLFPEDSTNKKYLYIQGLIYQKYKKLCDMSPTDSEYYKLKEWIDTAIKIPFNIKNSEIAKNDISNILLDIKKELDKELYGMDKVKEELLMAINQRFTNPSKSDTNIALVGPPGVGKTRIITILAKILNYPYEHISMGGTNDSSFLAGHSYTYEGARPGKIVTSLQSMKCNNGILFFDEIDKIANTSNGKEVVNQLLHITDFTQNDHFCDKYLPEIPIDLSKIWFIFSLNSIDDIDPILSNRLNYIYVDGYTFEDKIIIVKDYLLPKIYDKYNLCKDKYVFNDNIIKKIIIHSQKKTSSGTAMSPLLIPRSTLSSPIISGSGYSLNSGNASTDTASGIRELKRSIDYIFNRLSLLENMFLHKKDHTNQNIIKSLSFFPKDFNIKDLNKLKITEDLIDHLLK